MLNKNVVAFHQLVYIAYKINWKAHILYEWRSFIRAKFDFNSFISSHIFI